MHKTTTEPIPFPSPAAAENAARQQACEDALTACLRDGPGGCCSRPSKPRSPSGSMNARTCSMRRVDARSSAKYAEQRTIVTGLGPMAVKMPRAHDRRPAEVRERFTSNLLPPYLRKAKAIDELIPWLYLKGIGLPLKT